MHIQLTIRKTTILCFLAIFSIWGCSPRVAYEAQKEIGENGWAISDSFLGFYDVGDTNQAFNLVATSSVNENLPTYNHHIQLSIMHVKSSKRLFQGQYNLVMFNPESGAPLGEKIENGRKRSFVLLSGLKFRENGEVEIALKQYDRLDPMPGITKLELQLVESTD